MPSALAPPVHRLQGGKPILSRIESNPWESRVVFNPACALVTERGELDRIIHALPFDRNVKRQLQAEEALCFLLYRAQGKRAPSHDYTHSSIGLAVLSSDLRLLARHREPVLLPDQEYDDLGVEDARITKMDDRYLLFYTAYASGAPRNRIRIAVTSTTDLVHWTKHGLLKGDFNTIDNKNAMLFEEKVSGRFLMLHRPMEGTDAMAIHWAESDAAFGPWRTRGTLMRPIPGHGFVDTWIGGGAPPLKLPDGKYLLLYHIGNRKRDGSREYDLGLALCDPGASEPIVKRIEPAMRPEVPAETQGDSELGVNNVLFVCGAYLYGQDLWFPYAGADSVILGGRIARDDLEALIKP